MSEDYKISSVFFVRDIKTLHIPCKAVNKIGLYINNWIRLGKKIVYIHLFSKQAKFKSNKQVKFKFRVEY